MRIPHYIHMYTYIYPTIYIHVVYIPHNNPLFNKDIARSFVRMVFSFPFFNNRSAPFIFTSRIVHVLDLSLKSCTPWNVSGNIYLNLYRNMLFFKNDYLYHTTWIALWHVFLYSHNMYIIYIYPFEIGDCYTSGIRI